MCDLQACRVRDVFCINGAFTNAHEKLSEAHKGAKKKQDRRIDEGNNKHSPAILLGTWYQQGVSNAVASNVKNTT